MGQRHQWAVPRRLEQSDCAFLRGVGAVTKSLQVTTHGAAAGGCCWALWAVGLAGGGDAAPTQADRQRPWKPLPVLPTTTDCNSRVGKCETTRYTRAVM